MVDRKEYQRDWRSRNKEKLKEYRKNAAIRNAIKDINSGNAIVTLKKVLVMEHDKGIKPED